MPEPTEIRAGLLQSVEWDLLGPSDGPEEIVYEGRVRDRYLVGMLAPEGTIAIDRLLQRFPGLRRDGDFVRGGRARFRGFARYPIAW